MDVQADLSNHNMFSWRNKKDISIFWMKKNSLSVAMRLHGCAG